MTDKQHTIKVEIVSAEQAIYSGAVQMVFATATLGEVGIAPRHAPLLTALKPGQVRLQISDDKEEVFYISGGILEVQPYAVNILADTAVRADNLDEKAAVEAQERAKKALQSQKSDLDYSKTLAELAESAAQIQAIQQLRKRKR